MFTTNYKPNPFEVYNTVSTQFTNIKNLNSFISYSVIPANELISISNIVVDSIEKLGDIGVLYINKINSQTLPNVAVEQLQTMSKLHDQLIELMINFNKLSSDITNGFKETYTKNLNQDIINYVFYDIINRYKIILCQIINTIKKLNAYGELVKNKI